MIPSDRSDTRSVNQLRDVDLVIVRSVRFLHQHRMVYRQQEGQVVQTVPNSYRFNILLLSVQIPLPFVAGSSFSAACPLLFNPVR